MTGAARGTAHSGILLGMAQFWLAAAGYVVAVVLGRSLGPEPYGVYGIIYSLLLGIELIGRLGIPQALSRLIASGTHSTVELERTGIAASLVVALILFALFWAGAPQLAATFNLPDGTRLLRLAAFDIPIHLMFITCVHVVNGHRRFWQEGSATIIYASARAAGVAALLLIGVSIESALIANIIASAVGLLFVATRIPLASYLPGRRHLRDILRVAAPIALFSAGSQVLTRLDLWALGAVGDTVPADTVGHYVAATSLAKLPNMLFFVLGSLLIPLIAKALASQQRDVAAQYTQGTMRFLAVLLLPAVVLCAVQAADIMELCFGISYRDGGPMLMVLIVAYGLAYTVMMTLCAVLIALDRAFWSARLTLLAVVVSAVLNLVLVPRYGAIGAGSAALLTMVATCIAAGLIVRSELAQPLIQAGVALRATVAVAVVAWASMAIVTSGALLILELAVLLAAYLALLWVLRVIGRDDIALLFPGAARRSAD